MTIAMLEGPDLIIVAVIIMVLFGAKRLPEFARGLGQAKKEFEHAQHDTTTSSPPASESKAAPPAGDPTAPTASSPISHATEVPTPAEHTATDHDV